MISQKKKRYLLMYLFVSGVLAFSLAIASCSPKVTGTPIVTADSITVYTGNEEAQIDAYLVSFAAQYPAITVNIVRASSPVLTARLLAEKDNPQADVVWGSAASNLMILDSQGLLAPYAPEGLDRVNMAFRDSQNPPAWVGYGSSESAFCVNTIELEKNNLPMPESWYDLINPIYKGFIVMPDPTASGTGFLSISGVLQAFAQGKDLTMPPVPMTVATDSETTPTTDINALIGFKMDNEIAIKDLAGWEYLDALDENIAAYFPSGTAPCKMAGTGETVIGISSGYSGMIEANKGAPVVTVFPKEGSGWDLQASALIKKDTIKDAAMRFLDWAISDPVMKEYAKNYSITSVETDAPIPKGLPDEPLNQYLPNDFYWAAAQKESILMEWTTRYAVR